MKLFLKNELTIGLLAAILFIPFIGLVHLFDWDEINFAESAREMIVTGDYFSVQINYEKFAEKPPLFFWMQVASMKVFGINEFAARLPNALCGIATLVLLFRIGKKVFSADFGRVWVLVYLGTFFTFLYFKSGIIDPVFNLFIFLGIYHFYLLTTKEDIIRGLYAFYVGLFLGLAMLTKGPVAILIPVLVYLAYVMTNRFRFLINWKELLIIILTVAGVSFLWFGVDLIRNGPGFLKDFIQYQIRLLSTGEAGHDQPFFYHWWVLMLGCFPASIFFIQGMFVKTETSHQYVFKKWMLILFWVTLLLFSIVKTKIVHYSSLCWFPLTFLAALCIQEIRGKKYKLKKLLTILLAIIGFAIAFALVAIPFVLRNKDTWIDKVKDVSARQNLAADVQWHWYDAAGGVVLLTGLLAWFIVKKSTLRSALLFGSVTVCSLLTCVLVVPKIEAISQRANIEFFETLQGEDCYTATFRYKSYALYFYTRRMPNNNKQSSNLDWILHGKIDKPAYLSAKTKDRSVIDTIPGLTHLYDKNGFSFYKRLPSKPE